MTVQNWLERNGATPGKLAVVSVLALVLVAVVWRNIAGSSPAGPNEASSTTPPLAAVAKKVPAEPTAADSQRRPVVPKVWPKYNLDTVVKFDPLAKPTWYVAAHAAESGTAGASLARSAQVLEELKKQQTKIIVISGDERIATIGELSLRVGDTIEGFRVTEITTDGIVLTEYGR